MLPQCAESESVEAHELADVVTADSISSYPLHPSLFSSSSNFPLASASASSSSTIPYEEENTLSSLPLLRRPQINSIPSARVSFSSEVTSPSFFTKHNHDPDFPNTNSQNLYSAKAERWEHQHAMQICDEQPAETASRANRDYFHHEIDVTDASIPSYPSTSSSTVASGEGTVSSFSSSKPGNSQPAAETTSRIRNPNFLHVMEIIDEQKLGKHILGLAISMGVGLVFSTSALAKTTERRVVVIALSLAIAAIWNGLLLRMTNPETSTFILILGIATMMLAFYAFVGCFLPLYLKWIPFLCWLAFLVPFCCGWFGAYFPGKKVTDPETGEL